MVGSSWRVIMSLIDGFWSGKLTSTTWPRALMIVPILLFAMDIFFFFPLADVSIPQTHARKLVNLFPVVDAMGEFAPLLLHFFQLFFNILSCLVHNHQAGTELCHL